jgi:hypothetical protein
MAGVRRAIRVLPGGVSSPARRQPPLAAGYEHFRLERQGALLSAKTLDYYDGMVLPFLKWLDAEGVRRFDHLDVSLVTRLAGLIGRDDVDSADRSRCGAGATPTPGGVAADAAARDRWRDGVERVRALGRATRSAT